MTGSRSRRRRSRIPRPQPHWSVYVGALLLASGVLTLAVLAVITH